MKRRNFLSGLLKLPLLGSLISKTKTKEVDSSNKSNTDYYPKLTGFINEGNFNTAGEELKTGDCCYIKDKKVYRSTTDSNNNGFVTGLCPKNVAKGGCVDLITSSTFKCA